LALDGRASRVFARPSVDGVSRDDRASVNSGVCRLEG
jgi:hypothetical protein